MAYFRLTSNVPIQRYPYDYHSHFGGILPVDRGGNANQTYRIQYEFGEEPYAPEWLLGRELSLVGLLGGIGEHAEFAGQKALFQYALTWMERENPLAALSLRPDPVLYERGECTAENVYIACVLLAQRGLLPEDIVAAPATAPTLYRAVRDVVLPALSRNGERVLLPLLRYFNRKIYSANKYTPFDDVYKSRSAMMKLVLQTTDGPQLFQQWMLATYAYLQQSGVLCNQVAIGTDEIENASAVSIAYNQAYGTQYKLLAHTPAGYASAAALERDLNRKILPLLEGAGLHNVIGLDLLGTENKVSNYGTLLEFLRGAQQNVALSFGAGLQSRSQAMAVHIHCGEGAGSGSDNRSMIGYAIANCAVPVDAGFYRELSAYIVHSGYNTILKQADNALGTAGAPGRKIDGMSGLFDELFRADSFTWSGRLLRRFDINSDETRARVAYNGKRNAMAIAEALDSRPPEVQDGRTYYQILTAQDSIYALRLGHDFYYRSYIAAKFEKVAFDTNLGSNAITGAAGLFGSREGYHINRGFRHLEGYIDTDVLAAASAAVAYMGSDSLSEAQVEILMRISRSGETLQAALADPGNIEALTAMLRAVLAPIWHALPDPYALYRTLVLEVIGDLTSRAYGFQAMARVMTVFQNWRSYLFGADGQGVEHTELQDEFLRMLFMVAYQLLPAGQTRVSDTLLSSLQQAMLNIAAAYWRVTVGAEPVPHQPPAFGIAEFEGYKAPASVVVVRRARV